VLIAQIMPVPDAEGWRVFGVAVVLMLVVRLMEAVGVLFETTQLVRHRGVTIPLGAIVLFPALSLVIEAWLFWLSYVHWVSEPAGYRANYPFLNLGDLLRLLPFLWLGLVLVRLRRSQVLRGASA
jgi:hypothetical protein